MGAKKLGLWDLIEWHKKMSDSAGTSSDKTYARKVKSFHDRAVEALLSAESEARQGGLQAAADYVEQFDHRVNHPWRLSDTLLFKHNMLPDKKVRLNYAIPNVRERAKKARFMTLPGA